MNSYVSAPVPAGHLVVTDFDGNAKVVAKFRDEPEPRDVTTWFADLVLIGLGVRQELATGETSAPAEVVDVAEMTFEGDAAQARVFYIHHPSVTVVSMDIADAVAAACQGVAHQIAAGVAYDEAAGFDPSELLEP